MRLGLIGAAALATLSIPAAGADKPPKLSKAAKAYLALTPDQIAGMVAVKDDSLDTVATLSTEPVFQEKHGLLHIIWNDSFLRAFVDKKSGDAKYQVYSFISYVGDWRFYQRANYETPDGPQSVDVTVIDRGVPDCTSSRLMGGCTLVEHVGFDVPESLLRTVASKYTPGQMVAWRFKLVPKAGDDFQDGITAAEVGGLLEAVDRYRSQHNLAGSAMPPATGN